MTEQTLTAQDKEIERLKAENAELKSELERQPASGKGWRLVIIGLCIAAATAFLIVGNILFWTGDTLINSQKYSETISNVIKDNAVQEGIAEYATTSLFNNVDVSGFIQNALPPRASFLADPLTGEVRKATDATFQHVLAGEKFQDTFVQVNTNIHDSFIKAVKNSKSDGTINLQDIYNRLSDNLQNTKLSFLAGKTLPSDIGSIQVIKISWLPKARTIINDIGWIKPLTLFFVAIFSALAIWLARNRRKVVIVLSLFFAFGMLASLVSYRIVRSVIVSHTAAPYQTAVDHAAQIITHPLAVQTTTLLVLSVLVALIAWISGPYRAAAIARERLRVLLNGKLHQAIFGGHENSFTAWVGHHKRLLQWLAVALVGVIMLIVTLSPALIIKYAILMLILVLVVETLAAPYSARRR